MKSFLTYLNEGYNTEVLFMRLRKLVLDSYSNLTENLAYNTTELSYIKADLDKLKSKYNTLEINALSDYLLNTSYDLSYIFKLSDLEFIEMLDVFLMDTSNKLNIMGQELSKPRRYFPKNSLDKTRPDYIFKEIDFNVVVNEFNLLSHVISKYFSLIKVNSIKNKSKVYKGYDITRIIEGYNVPNYKVIPYTLMESGR